MTIRLSDAEGGTLVELTQETFKKPESAAGHQMGWTATMGKLERFLEG